MALTRLGPGSHWTEEQKCFVLFQYERRVESEELCNSFQDQFGFSRSPYAISAQIAKLRRDSDEANELLKKAQSYSWYASRPALTVSEMSPSVDEPQIVVKRSRSRSRKSDSSEFMTARTLSREERTCAVLLHWQGHSINEIREILYEHFKLSLSMQAIKKLHDLVYLEDGDSYEELLEESKQYAWAAPGYFDLVLRKEVGIAANDKQSRRLEARRRTSMAKMRWKNAFATGYFPEEELIRPRTDGTALESKHSSKKSIHSSEVTG